MRSAGVIMAAAFLLVLAMGMIAQAGPISFHGGNLTYAFVVVHIRNGTFEPDSVCIFKNATVVWVNQGPMEHSIGVAEDISPPILSGESYTKNFHEFGTFDYYCRYHPWERGKVIVR